MFNVTRSGFFLLCSALYISVAAQENYKVFCTEPNFEGKAYQYHILIECEKIKDAEYMKKSVKGVRAHAVLLPVVHNYEGTYPAIWKRIGDCTVDLYCVNIGSGERLEIGHPNVEIGLKAGTHQLKATTVRKDGSYI